MKKRLELVEQPCATNKTIEALTVNGGGSNAGNSLIHSGCGGRKECTISGGPDRAQSSAPPRSKTQQVHSGASSSSSSSVGHHRQSLPFEEYSCHAYSSQRSRCNCAGDKRATINGLIELFEQRLKVSESVIGGLHKMRAIVTPIKYEESGKGEYGDEDEDEEERDSLDGSQVDEVPLDQEELERKLCSPRWAPPTDGRQLEQRVLRRLARNHGYCPNSGSEPACSQRSSRCTSSIVKHRRSSSRTLLAQLARLRRLNEPKYCVRRPEKVAEVERLIEELERAAIDWEEDEHLLDRAERRDKPFPVSTNKQVEHSRQQIINPTDHQLALGERTDMPSLEQRVVSSSRTHHPRNSNYLSCRERTQDDLAIRRLTTQAMRPATTSSWAQPSYLLCMNSYVTPNYNNNNSYKEEPKEMQIHDFVEDQRIQDDDLHTRRLRSRPEPHEPPFGIPRQPVVHSSASHYLRRAPLVVESSTNQSQKRTDSRVSFASSVDSGLAAGASPVSTVSRHTPASPNQAQLNQQVNYDNDPRRGHDDDDDQAKEIELEELQRESSGVELFRTEYTNTPRRARPKIRIEKPRAKSPLLSTASHPKDNKQEVQEELVEETTTTTVRVMSYSEARRLEEVECKYDFNDEDEEEDVEDLRTEDIHKEKFHQIARAPVRVFRQPPPSTSNEDSTTSNEGSSQSRIYEQNPENIRMAPSRNKDAPLFRIGQYKPCESRAKLRIL